MPHFPGHIVGEQTRQQEGIDDRAQAQQAAKLQDRQYEGGEAATFAGADVGPTTQISGAGTSGLQSAAGGAIQAGMISARDEAKRALTARQFEGRGGSNQALLAQQGTTAATGQVEAQMMGKAGELQLQAQQAAAQGEQAQAGFAESARAQQAEFFQMAGLSDAQRLQEMTTFNIQMKQKMQEETDKRYNEILKMTGDERIAEAQVQAEMEKLRQQMEMEYWAQRKKDETDRLRIERESEAFWKSWQRSDERSKTNINYGQDMGEAPPDVIRDQYGLSQGLGTSSLTPLGGAVEDTALDERSAELDALIARKRDESGKKLGEAQVKAGEEVESIMDKMGRYGDYVDKGAKLASIFSGTGQQAEERGMGALADWGKQKGKAALTEVLEKSPVGKWAAPLVEGVSTGIDTAKGKGDLGDLNYAGRKAGVAAGSGALAAYTGTGELGAAGISAALNKVDDTIFGGPPGGGNAPVPEPLNTRERFNPAGLDVGEAPASEIGTEDIPGKKHVMTGKEMQDVLAEMVERGNFRERENPEGFTVHPELGRSLEEQLKLHQTHAARIHARPPDMDMSIAAQERNLQEQMALYEDQLARREESNPWEKFRSVAEQEQLHSPQRDLRELFEKTRPVNYDYKTGPDDQTGVMAQDLEKSKIGKQLVGVDEQGMKSINLPQAVPPLLAGMSEAQSDRDKIWKELKWLHERMSR